MRIGTRGDLARVAVIGTSCCGKTTFARQLSRALGQEHVELDALYWGPGWTARDPSEFRSLVAEAVASERWVVDGNYSPVQDLVWSRATAVVWLNYGFARVFGRALRRTIRRAVHREEIFSGNRESFRGSFLSRDSILWWVISTYRRRRRRYRELLGASNLPNVDVYEFAYPGEANAFLIRVGER